MTTSSPAETLERGVERLAKYVYMSDLYRREIEDAFRSAMRLFAERAIREITPLLYENLDKKEVLAAIRRLAEEELKR